MRDGEVVGAGVSCRGEVFCELGEAKSCEDGYDIGVVGEVEVEGLVEREGLGIVVEGGVDLGARVAEGVVFEAGHDFLLVADADCSLKKCRPLMSVEILGFEGEKRK